MKELNSTPKKPAGMRHELSASQNFGWGESWETTSPLIRRETFIPQTHLVFLSAEAKKSGETPDMVAGKLVTARVAELQSQSSEQRTQSFNEMMERRDAQAEARKSTKQSSWEAGYNPQQRIDVRVEDAVDGRGSISNDLDIITV